MTRVDFLWIAFALFVITAPLHGAYLALAIGRRLSLEQFEFVTRRNLKVGDEILFPSCWWRSSEYGPSEYLTRPLGSEATVRIVEETADSFRCVFVHKPHVSGWVYRSDAERREMIEIAYITYFYALPLAFWRAVVLRIPAREVTRV